MLGAVGHAGVVAAGGPGMGSAPACRGREGTGELQMFNVTGRPDQARNPETTAGLRCTCSSARGRCCVISAVGPGITAHGEGRQGAKRRGSDERRGQPGDLGRGGGPEDGDAAYVRQSRRHDDGRAARSSGSAVRSRHPAFESRVRKFSKEYVRWLATCRPDFTPTSARRIPAVLSTALDRSTRMHDSLEALERRDTGSRCSTIVVQAGQTATEQRHSGMT